jgi:hypothetical protein
LVLLEHQAAIAKAVKVVTLYSPRLRLKAAAVAVHPPLMVRVVVQGVAQGILILGLPGVQLMSPTAAEAALCLVVVLVTAVAGVVGEGLQAVIAPQLLEVQVEPVSRRLLQGRLLLMLPVAAVPVETL